jgi:hypothetical protein
MMEHSVLGMRLALDDLSKHFEGICLTCPVSTWRELALAREIKPRFAFSVAGDRHLALAYSSHDQGRVLADALFTRSYDVADSIWEQGNPGVQDVVLCNQIIMHLESAAESKELPDLWQWRLLLLQDLRTAWERRRDDYFDLDLSAESVLLLPSTITNGEEQVRPGRSLSVLTHLEGAVFQAMAVPVAETTRHGQDAHFARRYSRLLRPQSPVGIQYDGRRAGAGLAHSTGAQDL